MSNSVYDMLDIDETEGIDPTEIKAINATLSRIKVAAAGVAKNNDTTDTLAILKEMERVVRRVVGGGIHSVNELQQQLATNSAGQPAAALGSGSSSITNDTGEAIKVVLADTGIDAGFKQLIRRGYDQSAPDHIEVEVDGTPKELKTARKERDDQKKLTQKAENELADARDESKDGSLAKQLKDAKAAAPAAPFDKTKVTNQFEKVQEDLLAVSTKRGSAKVDGLDKVAQDLKVVTTELGIKLPKPTS